MKRELRRRKDAVWAALNDVEVLKQSIPGRLSLEKLSDHEMIAKVQVNIGPGRTTFAGKVALSELDPPNGYRLSGEGVGGPAGHTRGGASVVLSDDGDGTLMRCDANADVGGRLAQLGGRLIDSAAERLADQFFTKFSVFVEAQQGTTAAG